MYTSWDHRAATAASLEQLLVFLPLLWYMGRDLATDVRLPLLPYPSITMPARFTSNLGA